MIFPLHFLGQRVEVFRRPEKEHATQLRSLAELFKHHSEHRKDVRLVMIGGCRNAEDEARVESLRSLAKELDISVRSRSIASLKSIGLKCGIGWSMKENVQFVLNAPHSEVLAWLSRASIGLSTMVDEHFGINVVEFMVCSVPFHSSVSPPLGKSSLSLRNSRQPA